MLPPASRRHSYVVALSFLLLFSLLPLLLLSSQPSAAQDAATNTPCTEIAPGFDPDSKGTPVNDDILDVPCSTPSVTSTATLTIAFTPTPAQILETIPNSASPTPSGFSMAFAGCGSASIIEATYAIIAEHEEACFIQAVNQSNARPLGSPGYEIYLTGDLTFDGVTLVLPNVIRSLEIYGNNSLFTVSADNPLKLFSLSSHFILSHVSVTNGDDKRDSSYGGAVSNVGDLKIYDSVFDHNATLSGGGAIFSSGNLYLERVHFTNNHAGGGSAIQIDQGGRLTGDCVAFEDNSDVSDPLSGYGQSVLAGNSTGTNGIGGTVSLRRSGFRTKYVTTAGAGIWPQLFNLTNNSYTVTDSYFKPPTSLGNPPAAIVIDPTYRLETSANVAVNNPTAVDPTLESGCEFKPPRPLPQQTPSVACTAALIGPINIRSTPSSTASIAFTIQQENSLNTEFLGVYKAASTDQQQWWYLVRFDSTRLGWISGQVTPDPCPGLPITEVDQAGNPITPTPTPTPTRTNTPQATVTPGPSPTPSGNVIDQLKAYGIWPINAGISWTPQELDEILMGVSAVAKAFKSYSSQQGQTEQQVFKSVMSISPVAEQPETYLRVIRSSQAGGICVTDNNDVTITCKGANLIAPDNFTIFPFTEYVIVHELGHRFDQTSIVGNDDSTRFVNSLSSGLSITDCIGDRVVGEQLDLPAPDKWWTRGERGWGSGPARIGATGVIRQVTTFQQNAVLIQFQADPTTVDYQILIHATPTIQPPSLQLDNDGAKGVRVEEAAADMFLNWVYRLNSEGRPTASYATVCNQAAPIVTPVAFKNLSWKDGIQTPTDDPEQSGDRRFTWMDEKIAAIFSVHGW